MLATIVRGSLGFPRIVTALSLLIAIMGAYALLNARLDVFPDFAPPHVLVQAEAPGLDATQVESLVTRPLEGLLAGAENVEAVRSTSSQGLSAIQVVFGREGDPYRQRQVITERLADSSALLPRGVGPPLLSPLSSSMEYLLHFGFTSDRLSPIELRDLIRWTIKPQILAVPGVAQAQLFGGDSRERQLLIDPLKLQAAGVTLDDVDEAVHRGTQLIGGGYVETATQRIVLQAQPPGASLESLAQAVVATEDERFYSHHGIDTIGLGRAFLYDVTHFCRCEGGSTITEQLVKDVYLNGNDEGYNKLIDTVMALKAEQLISKRQIMADYVSEITTGFGRYGVTAAACAYFHAPLGSLTIGQYALLAGVTQAPSVYDPTVNPTLAGQRRAAVLSAMVSEKFITPAQAASAGQEPVLVPGPTPASC